MNIIVNINIWRSQGVGGRGSDTIFFHEVLWKNIVSCKTNKLVAVIILDPNLCNITKTLALKNNITFIYKVLRRMVETQLGLINPM